MLRLLFQDHDVGPGVARLDRGAATGGAEAQDDDVRLVVGVFDRTHSGIGLFSQWRSLAACKKGVC
jgi:hypothetical protein